MAWGKDESRRLLILGHVCEQTTKDSAQLAIRELP